MSRSCRTSSLPTITTSTCLLSQVRTPHMTRPPRGIVSARPGGLLSPGSVASDEGMVNHVRASVVDGTCVRADEEVRDPTLRNLTPPDEPGREPEVSAEPRVRGEAEWVTKRARRPIPARTEPARVGPTVCRGGTEVTCNLLGPPSTVRAHALAPHPSHTYMNRSPDCGHSNRFELLHDEGTKPCETSVDVEGDEPYGFRCTPSPGPGADDCSGVHVAVASPAGAEDGSPVAGPGWRRVKRRKGFGSLTAHALFLQHFFRRSREIRPGCWQRGGMRGVRVWRPHTIFACRDGRQMADASDFAAQRARASRVLSWYRQYTLLLRRLSSGRTPVALVTYCGQGAVAEGIRRGGGGVHGQDVRPMERFERRFGPECFSQGDSRDPHTLRALKAKLRAFFIAASPPCKAHSTSRMRGSPSEEAMIEETESALNETGCLHVIENVPGGRSELGADAATLRGSFFGLRVDKPRLFKANFPIHVDRALREGGHALRRRTCLGLRRRWRRLDTFGRPEMRDCCSGNIFSVQGDKPLRCTLCECSEAMGVDEDHMDYAGLSQAIPPDYAQLVFGQACMAECHRRFGIAPITFDEYEANPAVSARRMRHHLRGVGDDDATLGMSFTAPPASPPSTSAEADSRQLRPDRPRGVVPRALEPCVDPGAGEAVAVEVGVERTLPGYRPVHTDSTGDAVAMASEATVRVAELRELHYSAEGDFDQVCGEEAAWSTLSELRAMRHLGAGDATPHTLRGKSTLIVVGAGAASRGARCWAELCRESAGTRLVVEARSAMVERALEAAGFERCRRVHRGPPAYCTASSPAKAAQYRSFWAIGKTKLPDSRPIDYDVLESGMDPLDRRGAAKEPKSAKAARSYMPIPWEPERWDIGLPDELDEMMARRGVGIHPAVEPGGSEVPFYPFAGREGVMRSIVEADRALAVGAMEYVPASAVDEVLRVSTIHPWTIVDQGDGKWRLCHDYSVGTNRVVPSAPFSLPTVWEVAPIVKKSSFFAKYDIRDGFWHVPIAVESRKRLVVRHPGNGRLLWASRLPFGYVESPRLFCALTEAIIQRLRLKAAGKGIHFYVFVDDVLCVGDDEKLCKEGCAMIEAEFKERGIQWAPHKRRGPCQCIEFLGLMLSNMEPHRGITITRERMAKVMTELRHWQGLRPAHGDLEVDPVDLARLLGRLVFSSQVVRGGRTYMQGMLASFQGLVVDWRRSKVSKAGSAWSQMTVTNSFWRDIEWWIEHLEERCLTPFEEPSRLGEAVLSGTDASGWGTGQVIWLDGSREESFLRFTHAEKRRPINWRELLGIVRVAEMYGDRLRGKTLLVETDNMAANGATRKMASKAADMQEQIRRLYRLAETHGFTLRVTHTPGEKLDRPDQTSRGDSVEEPRVRLAPAVFQTAERRWGPFTGFLGAERELADPCVESEGRPSTRLWSHATVSTVGSALRMINARLAACRGGQNITALAVIPDDRRQPWKALTRHGLVVGRLAEGSESLEVNVLGRWRPGVARRASQILLFPRAAGAVTRRVRLDHHLCGRGAGEETGYAKLADGSGVQLPLLPGAFVYSLPASGHSRGCLSQIQPPNEAELLSDSGVVVARQAVLVMSKSAKRASALPVFDVMNGSVRYRPDPSEIFTVDHLVDELKTGATFSRYSFDFERANAEITSLHGRREEQPAQMWEALSPDVSGARRPLGDSGVDSGYEPFDEGSTRLELQAESEALAGVTTDLELTFAKQASLKTGTEGRLPMVAPIDVTTLEQTEGLREGAHLQPCPYQGIACFGCLENFRVGSMMESLLTGVVHPVDTCRLAARLRHEEDLEREAAEASQVQTYWGVFSEEHGASGVYTVEAQASRLVEPEMALRYGAVMDTFGTQQAAQDFVSRMTREHALRGRADELTPAQLEPTAGSTIPAREAVPGYGQRGSSTKITHLNEKLAPARIASVQACIDGRCGLHRDGSETMCRGGCGRSLHLVACANVGKGYAALGNFTCVECRLTASGVDPPSASTELRAVNSATMMLELTQGAESTAAGYADYVALEERYVLGMGMVLDGDTVVLPRNNLTSFKNMMTWMARDGNRALSLDSWFRSAGAFFTKLADETTRAPGRPQVTDFTKLGSVKVHFKELTNEIGVEHEPATACTPRMLKLAVEEVIPERCGNEFLESRETVQFDFEGVGGCRIGEVCGGGETHGLLANKVAILTDEETGLEVVEGHLEHSKTGFSRYLDMRGTTETSGIEVAQHIRNYWKAAKIPVRVTRQAGIKIERPDFYVVRVSLLGVGPAENQVPFTRLMAYLTKSKDPSVLEHLATSRSKGQQRVKVEGSESQLKKYINVAEGRGDSMELVQIRDELRALGFTANVVPGPFLLASTGGRKSARTIMPLSTSGAFTLTKEILTKAFTKANANPTDQDPDLEIDLAAGEEPKWSTHSLRRLADTVAQRYRERSGTSEAEIDIYFGWNERVLLKAMQTHYNGLSMRQRMKMSKITGML